MSTTAAPAFVDTLTDATVLEAGAYWVDMMWAHAEVRSTGQSLPEVIRGALRASSEDSIRWSAMYDGITLVTVAA